MFTGIITHQGCIESMTPQKGGVRVRLSVRFDTLPAEGASIACEGCCLTALEVDENGFSADVSPETLSLTTLNDWAPGRMVNLERSLHIGDELGGHMVTGHVDGMAELLSVREEGGYFALSFRAPQALARYIAKKGSVALSGVSLTVNDVQGDHFNVMIIPHTWDVTTLGGLQVGDRVNLEVDLMARYAARLQEAA